MDLEEWSQVGCANNCAVDGAPCAVKATCTVRSGGKLGDQIKELPITIMRLRGKIVPPATAMWWPCTITGI